MYWGWRDVLHAKGRFALIAGVVALITLLLVMLTGLTGGLGRQNTSVLTALGADRFVFGAAAGHQAQVDFASSQVSREQTEQWSGAEGVDRAVPVGFAQTQAEAGDSAGVAVVGVPEGSGAVERAAGRALSGTSEPGKGQAVLSEAAASSAGARTGGRVSLGGQQFAVAGIVPDQFWSHSPVVWTDTAGWQAVAHQRPEVLGTALAVEGTLDEAGWQAAAHRTDTVSATTRGSFQGLAAYSSEHRSLLTMQGFLYGISALVTVSFLTVWTIQRTRDLAVLRALGAGIGYLVRDAIGQAAVVLAAGVVVGSAAGLGLGALARRGVPFLLDAATVLGPAAGIWVLGLLGAVAAVSRVGKVDPLLALGGN